MKISLATDDNDCQFSPTSSLLYPTGLCGADDFPYSGQPEQDQAQQQTMPHLQGPSQ